MSQPFSFENITAGLLINVIFAFVVVVARKTRTYFERVHPGSRRILSGGVIVLMIVGNVILYFYTGGSYPLWGTVLLLLGLGALWSQLRQFWNVGLIGADRHIRGGIDYERSLQMCTNSMDFLGVGARKLTTQPQFEEAVKRCQRPSRPLRFLLCKPDSQLLVTSAHNAGQPADEYRQRVTQSLRTLADLKTRREWNIEVRFYEVPVPLFRLMFIDGWLCLASHYVFGEGDGSDWPQLHVIREAGIRDVNSLYFPFSQYFEQLWEGGKIWDFREYLEIV